MSRLLTDEPEGAAAPEAQGPVDVGRAPGA